MKNPAISVIIPSFNKPDLLLDCLESIKRQTLRDWQCIVVDDCSPYGSKIRGAIDAASDDRISYVSHTRNLGPAAARNTGCRLAAGDFVVCVDEDDQLADTCLEKLLNAFRDGKTDVVCSQIRCFGGQSARFNRHVPSKEEALHACTLPPCGFIMPKEIWRQVGGWDETPILVGREDLEFWIRIVHGNYRVVLLDEELYFMRVPASTAEKELSLNLAAMKDEVKKRKYILEKHKHLYDRYPKARRLMLAKAYWFAGVWRLEHNCTVDAVLMLLRSALVDPSFSSWRSILGLLKRSACNRVKGWCPGMALAKARGRLGRRG